MVGISSHSNFRNVAEEHIRTLREAGQTAESAVQELSALARDLAAEGQTEFAQVLTEVSRLHIAETTEVNVQTECARSIEPHKPEY